ncbi:hypothetical protein V6N13_112653 [Hibiscus sabdariffa]
MGEGGDEGLVLTQSSGIGSNVAAPETRDVYSLVRWPLLVICIPTRGLSSCRHSWISLFRGQVAFAAF